MKVDQLCDACGGATGLGWTVSGYDEGGGLPLRILAPHGAKWWVFGTEADSWRRSARRVDRRRAVWLDASSAR